MGHSLSSGSGVGVETVGGAPIEGDLGEEGNLLGLLWDLGKFGSVRICWFRVFFLFFVFLFVYLYIEVKKNYGCEKGQGFSLWLTAGADANQKLLEIIYIYTFIHSYRSPYSWAPEKHKAAEKATGTQKHTSVCSTQSSHAIPFTVVEAIPTLQSHPSEKTKNAKKLPL